MLNIYQDFNQDAIKIVATSLDAQLLQYLPQPRLHQDLHLLADALAHDRSWRMMQDRVVVPAYVDGAGAVSGADGGDRGAGWDEGDDWCERRGQCRG